jgi:hypothetical protein
MQALDCGRCGATVLVSKFSAEQTSIQWTTDSAVCPERAQLAVGQTCPALSESIQSAVLEGALGVSVREDP